MDTLTGALCTQGRGQEPGSRARRAVSCSRLHSSSPWDLALVSPYPHIGLKKTLRFSERFKQEDR